MRKPRIYRLFFILVVGASALIQGTVLAQGLAQADSAELGAVVRWIDTQAVSVDFDVDDYKELHALKPALQDVSVVGLGEATHGTHEFFAIKGRLVRFLVEELGFTTLALEAFYPECARMTYYLSRRKAYMAPTVLASDFDGLVFISTTTRAQPTPAAVNRLSGRPE